MSNTVAKIKEKLAALSPTELKITDDSASHAGHAGAKSGGGHFFLTIVSDSFAGKPTLARHRMVYDALGELMQKDIHALSITAYTAAEL